MRQIASTAWTITGATDHKLRVHFRPTGIILIAGALLLASFAGLTILRPDVFQASKLFVPVGSVLTVKVQNTLTSETTRVGDAFKARIVSAEMSDGTSIPLNGERVTGKCVAVRGKEGLGRPGYLRVSLTDYHGPRGHAAALVTSAVSVWGSEVDNRESRPGVPPITDAEELQRQIRLTQAQEAVITPETPISFVLLDPAVVSRWGERR